MSWMEIAVAAAGALGAGIGGGLVYARQRARVAEASAAPEPDPLTATGRHQAVEGLGALRCDRHQALEDAVSDARTGQAVILSRLDTIDRRLDGHHDVLTELRDEVRSWRPAARGGRER